MDGQKNICLIVGNLFSTGGEGRINALLANFLAKKGGVKVTLMSLFKTANAPHFEIEPNIEIVSIFSEPFNIKRHPLRMYLGLRRFFKARNEDVVISSVIGLAPFLEFGMAGKAKTAYWDHQAFAHGKLFGLAWTAKHIVFRLKKSTVVCLTKKSLDEYRRHLGASVRVFHIYNPLTDAVEDLPYNPDSKNIMSCGRLAHSKGFDMLIDVAKTVIERHPDWRWRIYGEGPLREPLQNKIDESGLSNALKLMGFHQNIGSLYPEHSIFVLTSRHEGFPLALTAAISAKLPIVSFDCQTGPAEIIDDGESGLLVECFDTRAMAEKICELIESRELRKKFSQKAFAKSRTFSVDKFLNNWEALLDALLKSKDRR